MMNMMKGLMGGATLLLNAKFSTLPCANLLQSHNIITRT